MPKTQQLGAYAYFLETTSAPLSPLQAFFSFFAFPVDVYTVDASAFSSTFDILWLGLLTRVHQRCLCVHKIIFWHSCFQKMRTCNQWLREIHFGTWYCGWRWLCSSRLLVPVLIRHTFSSILPQKATVIWCLVCRGRRGGYLIYAEGKPPVSVRGKHSALVNSERSGRSKQG